MKKVYVRPNVDINEFHVEDIITTSVTTPQEPVAATFSLRNVQWETDDTVVDIF